MLRNQKNTYRHFTLTLALAGSLACSALWSGAAGVATAQTTGPSWAYTGSLNTPRNGHTATLLPNGKVLVAGGNGDGDFLNSAELYDPATGVWSYTGNLNTARRYHTATLLPNGKVLVTGGLGTNGINSYLTLNTAELYDPATGTWSYTGNLNTARQFQTATLLPNGKVLVAGGFDSKSINYLTLNSAELYDPATGTWSGTGSLNVARGLHTATLLSNGKVLVAGGNITNGIDSSLTINSVELYDPATGRWSATGNLNVARCSYTATLLPDGKVLVAGGHGNGELFNSAELYDPATGTWNVTGSLNTSRDFHTATLLQNGNVLVVGGFRGDYDFGVHGAELYDSATGNWTNAGNVSNGGEHTATLLLNRQVLVAGGFDDGSDNSAILYNSGNSSAPNPIDDPQFFVRQQYLDFLNREPDGPGWDHWTGEITECSDAAKRQLGESLAQCVDRKRTNTSGAFFFSNEFKNSASYLLRVNWGSLGKAENSLCIEGVHSALPALCRPLYQQYIADMTKLTEGIVVNDQLDVNKINANKQAFVNEFVTRSDFLAVYGGLNDEAYVRKLEATTGVGLTDSERQDLISEAATLDGRAMVLQKIVDGTTTIEGGFLRFDTRYGKAFYDKEFNTAFVFIQYLGYLRRNPDQAGYDHWLGKLNFYGNFVDAEMVRSFLVSDEYRNRF